MASKASWHCPCNDLLALGRFASFFADIGTGGAGDQILGDMGHAANILSVVEPVEAGIAGQDSVAILIDDVAGDFRSPGMDVRIRVVTVVWNRIAVAVEIKGRLNIEPQAVVVITDCDEGSSRSSSDPQYSLSLNQGGFWRKSAIVDKIQHLTEHG
jgi:hypothetical protein